MRRTITTLLIGLLPGMAATAAESGRIEVRLRSSARTAGPVVRLSDVATVLGGPDALGQIVVLPGNGPAGPRTVRLDQVRKALRTAGFNPVPIQFGGAGRCKVYSGAAAAPTAPKPTIAQESAGPAKAATASTTAPAVAAKPAPTRDTATQQTLGDLVRRHMLAEIGGRPEDVTFLLSPASARWADVVPDEVVGIISTDRNRLGQRRWRADYTIAGRTYRRYLTATVTGRRDVLVAKRAMGVGETITAADIEEARRVDAGRIEAVVDPTLVVGQRVAKPLLAGQAITTDHLEAPELVQRGQMVWVTCGPVRLQAKALRCGFKGDSLELENPISHKRFRAVVTGLGQATMALAPAATTEEVSK